MSNNLDTEAIPRVGQKGTAVTATVKEPDPNNPGQFIIVDLTDADSANIWIEFRRPNQTTFKIAAVVFGTPTDGNLKTVAEDIWNMPGDWYIRGSAGMNDGSYYPGSWTLQPVGT